MYSHIVRRPWPNYFVKGAIEILWWWWWLKLVSYNMHGFNQVCPTINDLINTVDPDIILCQEHWLNPAK